MSLGPGRQVAHLSKVGCMCWCPKMRTSKGMEEFSRRFIEDTPYIGFRD